MSVTPPSALSACLHALCLACQSFHWHHQVHHSSMCDGNTAHGAPTGIQSWLEQLTYLQATFTPPHPIPAPQAPLQMLREALSSSWARSEPSKTLRGCVRCWGHAETCTRFQGCLQVGIRGWKRCTAHQSQSSILRNDQQRAEP